MTFVINSKISPFGTTVLKSAMLYVCAFGAIVPQLHAQTRLPDPVPVDTRQPNTTVKPVEANTPPTQGKDSAQVSAIQLPHENRADIKLGISDLMSIKVYGVPEMNDDIRINGAGDISLPLIGNIHVEGLTSEQIERLLEKKLIDGGYLREPHVTIFVKEYVTQGISVMGEISKPGMYPLVGARRLYDIITLAGGPTPLTGDKVTITHRDQRETPVVVKLGANFLSTMSSQEANIEIYPGDVIVFAKAGVVYVVGNVNKPGGYVMENNEGLTVLQVMAMAGGQSKDAALGHAKIIHKTQAGDFVKETPIPLDKIMAGKAKDLALHADDILFVPNSLARGAARKTLDNILGIITSAAIYRP
jgi:polysaccharide export outer membrane protein